MAKRLTNEDFRYRGGIVHNWKYIYDKTDVDNRDKDGKVIITCPIHGDFRQNPNQHLAGSGCRECVGNVKKTTESVIEEIKQIHGDKYIIPDDFEYKNNKTKLHIICPVHGDFYPTYNNFVVKHHGCKKCSCHIYENDEFINDLNDIYKDSFDFKNVQFKGYRKEVEFVCNKCGKINKARPMKLLNGNFKCECECGEDKISILEYKIKKVLDEKNIKYIHQYTDETWLKNIEALSLDFYLPEYNVAIECQGRFHFEPYSKDKIYEIEFLKQVERDKIKNKLCKERNIKIMYFSNINYKKEYIDKIYHNEHKLINEIIN